VEGQKRACVDRCGVCVKAKGGVQVCVHGRGMEPQRWWRVRVRGVKIVRRVCNVGVVRQHGRQKWRMCGV